MIILERVCVLTLILHLPHALYFPEPQPLLPTTSPFRHPAYCWNSHQRFGKSGRAPTYPACLIISFSSQTSLSREWSSLRPGTKPCFFLSITAVLLKLWSENPQDQRHLSACRKHSLWSCLSPSKLEYRGRTQKVIANLPGDSDACSGSKGDTLCCRH